MISSTQQQFLVDMYNAALAAGHIFPEYAACEAAEETGWGTTQVYLQAHNVFGQKAPTVFNAQDKVLTLPTWEVLNGAKVKVTSHFLAFDSVADAFKQRMALLTNLPGYYSEAVAAATGEQFVREVCAMWTKVPTSGQMLEGKAYQEFSDGMYLFVHGRWSTDPKRAANVLAIYNAHNSLFKPQPAPVPVATVAPDETAKD